MASLIATLAGTSLRSANKSSNNPLILPIRHGKDPVIADIANLTFNDPMLADGTLVKNVTFAQVADQVYAYPNKNNSSLTTPTKN